MKRKEMIQLLVAIVIIVAAGALIFSQLQPKKGASSSQNQTVEVVTPINPNFDSASMSFITDNTKVHDFYQAPNLSNLGNNNPFGQ